MNSLPQDGESIPHPGPSYVSLTENKALNFTFFSEYYFLCPDSFIFFPYPFQLVTLQLKLNLHCKLTL